MTTIENNSSKSEITFRLLLNEKVFVVLFTVLIILSEAVSQDIPTNDIKLMNNFIMEMLIFKKEIVASDDLTKVFSTAFI